jgi:hypothetical protein
LEIEMHWKPSLLLLLVSLLPSAPALAGDAYDFTVTHQGEGGFDAGQGPPMADSDLRGRLIVDGRSYRLELAPGGEDPPLYQALVSKDGGAHEIALNLANHTFFAPRPRQVTSSLLRLLPVGDASVSNVNLESSEAPETLDGIATRKREIHLFYDVAIALSAPVGRQAPGKTHVIETVHGKVTVEAVYWLAPGERPALPELLRPEIRTGFADVDAKLAAATAALAGVPLQQRITISSTGDQGATPLRSVRTVRLENHQRAETRPELFEVPPGFRKHEPQISHPGFGGALPPG